MNLIDLYGDIREILADRLEPPLPEQTVEELMQAIWALVEPAARGEAR